MILNNMYVILSSGGYKDETKAFARLVPLWLHFSSLVAQKVKNLPAVQETQVQSMGQEDPLEKGMAAHSSVLTWRIHGQKSLVGCSPRGCKELGTTEQLTLSLFLVAFLGLVRNT